SYERYAWIISGPYPYDNLGGGQFQVMVYSGLFAAGFVLTSPALILRSPSGTPSDERPSEPCSGSGYTGRRWVG
ncbi:MAG TPA: hypothetical protein VGV91_18855, partial [Rubrobacter sp.]|nr:hypothetical protein [Rubrobacter sp.]